MKHIARCIASLVVWVPFDVVLCVLHPHMNSSEFMFFTICGLLAACLATFLIWGTLDVGVR